MVLSSITYEDGPTVLHKMLFKYIHIAAARRFVGFDGMNSNRKYILGLSELLDNKNAKELNVSNSNLVFLEHLFLSIC